MALRLPRRFRVVLPWLRTRVQGRCRDVTALQLLHYLTRPSMRRRGFHFVTECRAEDDVYVVKVKGYDRPIYWPKGWSLDTLGMLISEQFDIHDWHYYQVMETRLEASDVVVDCGAAEGLFTLIAADTCRRVYAVEPLPTFCRHLTRSFAGLTNVQIVPCLLGNRIGEARLSARDVLSAESPSAGVPCRVDTLDHIFADDGERVTYLKADVEGAELDLLAGARALIRRDRPKIAITTYHHPGHAEAITRLLLDLDSRYRIRTKGISEHGCPVMLHAWVPPDGA